jgi:hypothetical protein
MHALLDEQAVTVCHLGRRLDAPVAAPWRNLLSTVVNGGPAGGHMHIVGEWKLDFRGYRRLALPAFGRAFPIVQLFLLAFAIWMGLSLAANGFSALNVGYLVGAVVGAVIPEVAVLIGWRRTAKVRDEPWRYVVTEATVGIHTPLTEVTTRWEGIVGARRRRHMWLLKLANKALLPIPRAAFATADAVQIDALAATAGARTR